MRILLLLTIGKPLYKSVSIPTVKSKATSSVNVAVNAVRFLYWTPL